MKIRRRLVFKISFTISYLLHVTPHCLVSSVNDTNDFLYTISYILHLLWRLKMIESITYSDVLVILRLAFVKLERMNNILWPLVSVAQRIVLGICVHLTIRCTYLHLHTCVLFPILWYIHTHPTFFYAILLRNFLRDFSFGYLFFLHNSFCAIFLNNMIFFLIL